MICEEKLLIFCASQRFLPNDMYALATALSDRKQTRDEEFEEVRLFSWAACVAAFCHLHYGGASALGRASFGQAVLNLHVQDLVSHGLALQSGVSLEV